MNKYDVADLTAEQLASLRDRGLVEVMDLPVSGLAYVLSPDYPDKILQMRVKMAFVDPLYGTEYILSTWAVDAVEYSMSIRKPRGMAWVSLEALRADLPYAHALELIPYQPRPAPSLFWPRPAPPYEHPEPIPADQMDHIPPPRLRRGNS